MNTFTSTKKKNNSTLLFSMAGIAVMSALASALPAYAAVPIVISTKVTGPNTLTVLYSEAVQTNTWDYTNFSGNLSGRGVIAVSGQGTNVITLTLSGDPLSSSAAGYLTIGGGVTSISDHSAFPGGTFSVTNAQAPILSSVSVSMNNLNGAFSSLGSQINLTFTTNESVVNPTVTILGHTIGVNGTGNGPYSINYVVASGDAQGSIPATITFTDTSGNTGSATVSIIGNGTATSGTTSGTVSSNANTPGALYVGNAITFTFAPTTPQPNARVTGSYNGVPLAWYTTNSGATFTSTYTVLNGQANTTSPLQISGVSLIDNTTGNVLGTFSGSDIQKTITASNANGPIYIYQSTAVPTTGASPTPSYTFISSAAGTIRYGGDCASPTISAVSGLNTVIFNSLANGLHSNCTISVSDGAGNISNQIVVSPFTVGTPVTTPTVTSPSSTDPLTAQLQALQSQLAKLQGQTQQSSNVTAKYTFSKALLVGSTGTEVTELQKRLTTEGVYSGSITGRYGALTEAAVKKYQTKHGLKAVGTVGPATRAALNNG